MSTATPSNYTVADLLNDTTGPHEGSLCPLVNGYDWQFRGRVKGATGGNQIAAWGTVQWASCGASVPVTDYEIRNLRVYARVGASWLIYPSQNDPLNWCSNTLVDTYNLIGGCTRSGAGWRMLTGQAALHWGESTDTLIPGAACHVVLYEARSTGAGIIMANTGLDWRVGSNSVGDSWFGSYQRLTADWMTVGGTSCTAAQLAANPPTL